MNFNFLAQATPITPSNKGVGDIARERTRWFVSAQNERLEQTLRALGTNILVWNKTKSNLYCSCQKNSVEDKLSFNVSPMLDFDKKLHIDAVVPEQSFKIVQTRGNIKKTFVDVDQKPFEELIQKTASLEDEKEFTFNQPNSSPLISNEIDLLTEGGDKTPCGICFGTGVINGYELFGGKRIVLEAKYASYDLNNFEVLNNSPNVFQSSTTSSIKFNLEFPTYFTPIKIKVYNNLQELEPSSYRLDLVKGLIILPLTFSSLESLQGQKNNVSIILSPTISLGDIFEFTHIEIVLGYADYFKCDMPPINIPENFEQDDFVLSSNMVLSTSIANVDRGSIINDQKYGLLWKVTNVTKASTVSQQVFNQEVDVRAVQNYEQVFNLKVFDRSYNQKYYRGLELVQGENV